MENEKSCDISSGCKNKAESSINYKSHWDSAYTKSNTEKLGWYENDLTPTLKLIERSQLNKNASVLNVGAGSTTLIDELLTQEYTNIIASDISAVSLQNLKERVANDSVKYIVDDLTAPTLLNEMESVDLWIDRAVLHFFTEKQDQDTYFDLLKKKVKKGGHVLLAEFKTGGATKCCGLPIHQYDNSQFQDCLGSDFEQVETFDHIYINPNGAPRPYIYTLFVRV